MVPTEATREPPCAPPFPRLALAGWEALLSQAKSHRVVQRSAELSEVVLVRSQRPPLAASPHPRVTGGLPPAITLQCVGLDPHMQPLGLSFPHWQRP